MSTITTSARSASCADGRKALDHSSRTIGRHGTDHRIELVTADLPAGSCRFDIDVLAEPEVPAVLLEGVDGRSHQLAHPAAWRPEDRRGRCGRGADGAASDAACREEQASVVGERGELGDLGEAEVVGVGGVDAADQGVDQAFVHLVAES